MEEINKRLQAIEVQRVEQPVRPRTVATLTHQISSSSESEIFSEEEHQINKITNWSSYPRKMYYPRPTLPDLVLEERGQIIQNQYSANTIYEWNIDGITEI